MTALVISILLALLFLLLVGMKSHDVILTLGLLLSSFASGYYLYEYLLQDRFNFTYVKIKIPKENDLNSIIPTPNLFRSPKLREFPGRPDNDA